MELSLQSIYLIVGIAGFVLAALCAIAAIAYFIRSDIPGVRADLSGRTRQEGLAAGASARRRSFGEKGSLVREGEWQGEISRGRLDEASGSDAITEEGSSTGASSDFLDQKAPKDGGMPCVEAGGQGRPSSAPYAQGSTRGQLGAPGFALVKSCVLVHADVVIGQGGREVPAGEWTWAQERRA